MALNLKNASGGRGGWLKPADHADDHAILIEVTGIDRQRPTDYGPRDSVVCTLTFFATPADLDALTPSEIQMKMRIEQTALASSLIDDVGIGGAAIQKLAKATKSKPGQQPAWIWAKVSQTVANAVVAYAEKREAETAEAMAAAPSFDD